MTEHLPLVEGTPLHLGLNVDLLIHYHGATKLRDLLRDAHMPERMTYQSSFCHDGC